MDKITLRVEGMSCEHCEIAIQDAIRKLPGIKKAKASKRKKEVSVKYDATLTSGDAIIHAIADTGYQVIA
ncbi:MAG: cation transporter [Clostridiales Family XIII bacterium]|jgi:copper ion binding protein|nr:cation transporter [Clostridiales Family XIII bacterium]